MRSRMGLERAAMLAVCIAGLLACGDDDKGDDKDRVQDGAVPSPDGSVSSRRDGGLDGSLVDGAVTVLPDSATEVQPDAGSGAVACAGGCNDNVDCTLDSCENGACQHRVDERACAAGSSCSLTMGCQQGKPCTNAMDCADMDGCTAEATCNTMLGRCEYTVLDQDGDGYPPASCGGADCDDQRGLVSPSQTESCNGRDDDCDGMVDEGVQPPAGSVCTNGRLECAPGFERCGPNGLCVDLQTDRNNCGGCLTICDSGETCTMGECTCTVGGSIMMCGGLIESCADITQSEQHCGGCDNDCVVANLDDPFQACVSGTCVPCGGENQACCDNGGISVVPICLPGLRCEGEAGGAGSKCVCPAGSIKCGDACVDVATSNSNCGMCGRTCDPGATCVTAGGSSSCQPCGGLGERCCSGFAQAPCDGGGRVCGPDDTCVLANAGGGPG